jgi:hypothetical protein
LSRFRHFAAVDWSGAAGERHRGIALAICSEGSQAPHLVRPGHRWSREDVLDWLLNEMPGDTLVGFDLGISLPFEDSGAFFPGWSESPADARALWALVDEISSHDPHLAVTSFVNHPAVSRYFRRQGGREGDAFHHPEASDRRGRFRVTEAAQASTGCRPYSNFNLVGAAQVGKSSLTGMRVLHRLGGRLPVWPIDPLPSAGSVVVEIYTSIAARTAGRSAAKTKMRSLNELNAALAHPAIGSLPVAGDGAIADHASDALLTAAWLRRAAEQRKLWNPPKLDLVAATEGWTFGAP